MTATDPKTRLDHRRMHSRVEAKVESLNGCDVRVDLTDRPPSIKRVCDCLSQVLLPFRVSLTIL